MPIDHLMETLLPHRDGTDRSSLRSEEITTLFAAGAIPIGCLECGNVGAFGYGTLMGTVLCTRAEAEEMIGTEVRCQWCKFWSRLAWDEDGQTLVGIALRVADDGVVSCAS